MKNALLLIAIYIVFVLPTSAQNTTKTHTVTLAINNILELDFDNSAQNLGFTFATATDFESGKTNLSAAGLRVRSNKPWTVSVKANTVNFSATAGGDANVPASSLSVRKNGTTANIALTTSDQSLATGNRGGFGVNTFSIDYLANPGYISPATYSLGVTFTVTAP
ncbi:hypothetical protein EGI22_04925 [Lacihabitans sp. LS3-19]|uniref:hypothetical protein n=1 Tax=Lacihabitans sp. LS3-19 TaxID=2487335 RepID=UPI0020CEC4ED|nr:hypothetical protein [Lacihabitans sp. LS3-19]MCP9767243.1 hypothetical protein [Lacihabitans sp. LS3-19]